MATSKIEPPEIDTVWRDGAMTVTEATQFTGIGRTKMYELAGQGAIPTTVVGGRRLFARQGLVSLLASGATESIN